jgi:kinesin family protein 1
VESSEDAAPTSGTFLLHQGIQRRIAATIVHEDGNAVDIRQVHMMTIGNVRNTPNPVKLSDCGEASLVLNPSSVPSPKFSGDTRLVY